MDEVADNRDLLCLGRTGTVINAVRKPQSSPCPLKIKACALHMAVLMEKHPSVFTIAAFDFIERPEGYAEYTARRSIKVSHSSARKV